MSLGSFQLDLGLARSAGTPEEKAVFHAPESAFEHRQLLTSKTQLTREGTLYPPRRSAFLNLQGRRAGLTWLPRQDYWRDEERLQMLSKEGRDLPRINRFPRQLRRRVMAARQP